MIHDCGQATQVTPGEEVIEGLFTHKFILCFIKLLPCLVPKTFHACARA